jgi:hypothetical protein
MRLIIVFIIMNSFWNLGFSQDSVYVDKSFQYRNSIQSELFGHGVLYSINYERIVLNRQSFKTTGQIGFSYYPPSTGIIELWIPIVFNELISFDKHHIEVGIGYIFNKDISEWDGFLTGRIGYRYQKPVGRLILRVGFTPFIKVGLTPGIDEHRIIKEFIPSGGLSLGYNF